MEKEETIYIRQIDKDGKERFLSKLENHKGVYFRLADFIKRSNFEIKTFNKISEAVLFFDALEKNKHKNEDENCDYEDDNFTYEIVHEVKTIDFLSLSN